MPYPTSRKPASPAASLFFTGLLSGAAGSVAGAVVLHRTPPWASTDQASMIFAGAAVVTGIFWITALAKR